MEQNPLVSFMMATHDRAELSTTGAIPSVLNQTYRNFELIVADYKNNHHNSSGIPDSLVNKT